MLKKSFSKIKIKVSSKPSPLERERNFSEVDKSEIKPATPLGTKKVLTEMPKKAVEISDLILKGAIYLLVFLLPIFFLPWTANALDFNKQALLMILVFTSLFFWMIKILILGKINLNLTNFHIPVGVFVLVFFASTIFSLWSYGSFWGWPLVSSESFLSLICLFLLYFLIANNFKKIEIFNLINLLALSGFLAVLFGTFQLFNKFILPWGFTKTASFNTIGSVNKLGIFSAVFLPLIIGLLIINKNRFLRLIFGISLIFNVLLLVLVNFPTVWWIAITGTGLLIVLGLQRSDFFDSRWMILPMVLLVISLFFIFFDFRVPGTPVRPVEFYLEHQASFDVALKTIKQRPILGSGPGTFIYDFSQYKDIRFNQSPLWNVRFDSARSKIINILATGGILGIISILAIIGLFVFYGIKVLLIKPAAISSNNDKEKNVLLEKEKEQKSLLILTTVIFISFIALAVSYFLYSSNLTLDFIFFLLLASFIGLILSSRYDILLKPSSLLTLSVTFISTLVFIFVLGLFVLGGQRYAAELNYFKGIKAWQRGDINESLNNLEKAATLNPKTELYWRELSQVYFREINEEVRRTDLSRAEINRRIQLLINNAVNSAKKATDINPKNVANWSVRGFIYQNLIGTVRDTKDWAIKSYEEALMLEPNNPYFFTQSGISLLREATFLSEGKEKNFDEAKSYFEKAIELKPDYAPAHFQLAMTSHAQGEIEEAIEKLERIKILAPSDVGLAFQLGLIYFQSKNYQLAETELERAVLINPNYSNALYFLGLTYDQQGEKSKAIEKFEKLKELNPQNREIQIIFGNLRAGRRALEGIAEEVPPKIPIEEEPAEIEEK